MTIEGIKFKVEYDYEDLNSSGFLVMKDILFGDIDI